MSIYDADDFNEEFVNEDEEDANAFEVTMSAIFEGKGEDADAVLESARRAAEESVYDGLWEIDEGKLAGEPKANGRTPVEFTATGLIQADSMEEALDMAASELSDDWDIIGEPLPVYIDEFDE
ncbi:MAG TPA: hypothetical protein VKQ72_19160 [Aggregatilineales bacterium]|nr:hypothetical protein [Aggregatilineales bacterium]